MLTKSLILILFPIISLIDSSFVANHRANRESLIKKREVQTDASLVPTVKQLHAISSIQSRFAMTQVTSKLANPNEAAAQVVFTMTLPDDAFISNFSMKIGDKVIVGEVKEKEEAKKAYDDAVARGESAGHVAQKARQTNVFTISANVGGLEKVAFNLTYQQLLKRSLGYYQHAVNIKTDQLIDDMKLLTVITEKAKIIDVHVPEFAGRISDKSNIDIRKLDPSSHASVVQQITDDYSVVFVEYNLDRKRQKELSVGKNGSQSIDGQLVVIYDIDHSEVPDEIQVVNGYFVHFIAPSNLSPGNKHVVFLLDRSGSMQGRKMEQTKNAMEVILRGLVDGDVFNIVTFASDVQRWKSESVQRTNATIDEAIEFVKAIDANGGTNINEGLVNALELVNAETSDSSTLGTLLIFMTDGQATSGVTNSVEILQNIRNKNEENNGIIHSIAFGNNADFSLMKQISSANKGIARKVYEDSDASLQLENFFHECSKLLLADVEIKYLNETVKPESLIQDTEYNYYEGAEIVVAGKLTDKNTKQTLKAQITGKSAKGEKDYSIEVPIGAIPTARRPLPHPPFPLPCIIGFPYPFPPPNPQPEHQPLEADTIGGFVERTWAYLTIKKLLDEIEYNTGSLSKEDKENNKKKALEMSLKYHFVTSLTSMVVIQGNSSKALKESTGASPQTQSRALYGKASSYRMASRAGAAPPAAYGLQSYPGLPGPRGSSGRASAISPKRSRATAMPPPKTTTTPKLTFIYPTTLPPPICGPNEVVNKCGAQCEKTCAGLYSIRPCILICAPAACECAPGYARQNGTCIKTDDCPNVKCPTNEHRIAGGCYKTCDQRCGESNDTLAKCISEVCDGTMCKCNDGYVRDDNNKCILAEQCPQPTTAGCEDENEELIKCGDKCTQQTCDNMDSDPDCSGDCGQPKCVCKEGFVLENLQCVPFDECS